MTRENFGHVGRLFKLTKKRDNDFIKRVIEVFEADWFYGYVDRIEAEKQLNALAKKEKSNLTFYIVRFATSKQLCFSYPKKDGTFEHSNIDPADALNGGGYRKYVSNYQRKFLKHERVSSLQKSFTPYSPNKKNK